MVLLALRLAWQKTVSKQGSDLHAPGPLIGSIRRDVDVGQAAWSETDTPSIFVIFR
jgi:hypothetical protein